MEMQKEEAKMLQWHPAFFAEIQIELQEDAEHLIFENEHQLGTKRNRCSDHQKGQGSGNPKEYRADFPTT